VRSSIAFLTVVVIVTVWPVVDPAAEQWVNPPVSAIVGVGGMKKALGKTAVIVSPVCRAPVELFAPEELDALRFSGFQRVSLGPRILRAETAELAALVWLQTRYGDMAPA
jgi:hypothetical protein